MRIRVGGGADAAVVLGFLDEAVAWMVERGQTGQWGARPWSEQPERVELVGGLAEDGLWIAEVDGEPAGAMVLRDAPPKGVPAVEEDENYVRLLVTSRRFAGRGVGGALLDLAKERTRAAGLELLRVDCWAGNNGRLVAYYASQGFTPTTTFAVGDWPGQVLELRP